MTQELKTLQRQVIENGVNLPKNNSFAGIQNALTNLSSLGTFAAEKIATERAAQQGLTDAQANQGQPKKLAPGLTNATKAYNNAYNNMETNLVALNAMKLMDDDLRTQSEPGKLNSQSVATYSEFAQARIQGALDGTSEQNKANVGLRLSQHLMSSAAKMGDRVSAYNLDKLNSDFAFVLDENIKTIYESSLGGDGEGIQMAANAIEQLVSDRKALNLLSPAQEKAIWDQTNAALIDSRFTAEYLAARVNGTSEQYLADFATTKPDTITFEQWRNTASKLLSLKSQQDKLVNEQQSLALAQWNQKLATGQVQSLDDLDAAKMEMPATDFTQLQTRFLQAQQKGLSQQQKVAEFTRLNVTNPAAANRLSADVKNEAYQQLLDMGTSRKREATNDPDAQLSLIEKADMVSTFNVPIPAFNDELNYALVNGSPTEALEGALAYKRLAGEPNRLEDISPVLSLDKKAEQIAVSALFQAGLSATTLPEAVERARKGILLTTDIERQARLDVYQGNFGQNKIGVKNTKNLFKEIFQADADNNPTAYRAMQNLLRVNAAEMPGLSEAKEMTKRQMTPVWGKSKYGKAQDEVMFYPPEKNVAFIDNGYWFDNQKTLALHQIAKNFERQQALAGELGANRARLNAIRQEAQTLLEAPTVDEAALRRLDTEAQKVVTALRVGETTPSTSVKWGLPNQQIPAQLSESQLLSEPLLRGISRRQADLNPLAPEAQEVTLRLFSNVTPKLEINGKAREIYIDSDASTRNRDNGKITYGFYYTDDLGFTQPVPDPFNPRGVAEWAVDPFDSFLPQTARQLSDKTINQVSEDEARALFARDNPRRTILENLPVIGQMERLKRTGKEKKAVAAKAPEIANRLREKRDSE